MGIFTDLTVKENMVLAARAARRADELDTQRLEWIFGLFPALKKFWLYPAGKLSGGQKQMLAVARAIVEPRALLLIDEPSKGLAPSIIKNLIAAFTRAEAPEDHDPAGRAELPRWPRRSATACRGDGRRPRRAQRRDGASWPTTRRCSSACWACRWGRTNEHDAVDRRTPRRRRRDPEGAASTGSAGAAGRRASSLSALPLIGSPRPGSRSRSPASRWA